MSIPTIGDRSYGLQLTGSIQGVDVAVDYLYSLNGAVIASGLHIDTAPMDTTFAATQLQMAVARLRSTT